MVLIKLYLFLEWFLITIDSNEMFNKCAWSKNNILKCISLFKVQIYMFYFYCIYFINSYISPPNLKPNVYTDKMC